MAGQAGTVIFETSCAVELYSVEGDVRIPLVSAGGNEEDKGHPLVIKQAEAAGDGSSTATTVRASVGPVSWRLTLVTHTIRSSSTSGEPSVIFSSVDDNNPELFYCVVMHKAAQQDLDGLSAILGKLTNLHKQSEKGAGTQPSLALPSITHDQVTEVLRKGAEDTQAMLKQAGQATSEAFAAAVELHKKYAPRPTGEVEVCPILRERIAKSKEAAAMGGEAAQGAVVSIRTAAKEIGASLVKGAAARSQDGGGGAEVVPREAGGGSGLMARPEIKAVGCIGKEIFRDVAAVRGAMMSAAGTAWGGLRAATRDVFEYQYGGQAAETIDDSCEVVEGLAAMGLAMKLQPAAGWT